MKRYVDGIGYIEVVAVGLGDLPRNAIWFGFDEDYGYYVVPDGDTVYAVKM